jgi:hypothetical protein
LRIYKIMICKNCNEEVLYEDINIPNIENYFRWFFGIKRKKITIHCKHCNKLISYIHPQNYGILNQIRDDNRETKRRNQFK